MNVAAISFFSSTSELMQRRAETKEVDMFAMIFQQTSVDLEEKIDEKPKTIPEETAEKIKHILENIAYGEGLKEELLSILPSVPLQYDESFWAEQMDEQDWHQVLASMLQEVEQGERVLGEDDQASIMHMLQVAVASRLPHEQQTDEKVVHRHVNDLLFKQQTVHPTNREQMEKLMNELQAIDDKAKPLINQLMGDRPIRQAHVHLTRLLEQYDHVQKELSSLIERPTNEQKEGQLRTMLTQGETSSDEMWDMLKSLYEKRSLLTTNNAYTEQAKVRPSDVGAWIEQLLSTGTSGMHVQTHVPLQQHMSTVEQHVIHMNIHDGVLKHSDEMIHQLKQIVTNRSFMNNPFIQQLSISIQPEQLGELTIRLMQVDGQMIAKITVQSQLAKQALESNMHQLKHMFAPHQVVIERQEGAVQTQIDQEHQEENVDDSEKEQHEENHSQDQQQETSFQEQFEQILNERAGE